MTPLDTGAYRITTRENGRLLTELRIEDPFVFHRIVVRGWRNALRVLFRRYELVVVIDADRALVERVLELNPDYLGPPGSPSRTAWNAHLHEALTSFASDEAADG